MAENNFRLGFAEDALMFLRDRGYEPGRYSLLDCYIGKNPLSELFSDTDFVVLWRGKCLQLATDPPPALPERDHPFDLMGFNFIPTTEDQGVRFQTETIACSWDRGTAKIVENTEGNAHVSP
jgi:hypothetical protein